MARVMNILVVSLALAPVLGPVAAHAAPAESLSLDEILARAFAAGAGNLNGFGQIYTGLWLLAMIDPGLSSRCRRSTNRMP